MSEKNKILEEKIAKSPQRMSSKRSYPSSLKSVKRMSLLELKSQVRSPDHFIWLFGVEMRYHLPPRSFVTWPFIIQVLAKNKMLVKTDDVALSSPIPKIKELNMKKIWPFFCKDELILRYMPVLSDDRLPPRTFFFEILSTIRPKKFEALMNKVQAVRASKDQEEHKVVFIDLDIYSEMKRSKVWKDIGSKRTSKRILTKPVKRRIGNSGNVLKGIKE